jgi:hypothetical protein
MPNLACMVAVISAACAAAAPTESAAQTIVGGGRTAVPVSRSGIGWD